MVMELLGNGSERTYFPSYQHCPPLCQAPSGRLWTTNFFNLVFDPLTIFYRFVTSFFERAPESTLPCFTLSNWLSDAQVEWADKKIEAYQLPEHARPIVNAVRDFFSHLQLGNGAIRGQFQIKNFSTKTSFTYTGPAETPLDETALYGFLKKECATEKSVQQLKMDIRFAKVNKPLFGRVCVEKDSKAYYWEKKDNYYCYRVTHRFFDQLTSYFYKDSSAEAAVKSFFND